MESLEPLVMRLCEPALAGNIHHQHRLAGELGEENLRNTSFIVGIVYNDLEFTLCPRWSSAERSKKSSAACDITVLIRTAKMEFRNILKLWVGKGCLYVCNLANSRCTLH